MKKKNVLNKVPLFLTIVASVSFEKQGFSTPLRYLNNTTGVSQSEDSLVALFRKYIVSDQDYYRNILYTWTTKEQILEIKNNSPILIKSQGKNSVSFYEKSLKSKEIKNHPLTIILRQEQFQKKRFTWNNAWAICNGEKDYGSNLLKITLKEEALICRINPFFPDSIQIIDNKGFVIPDSEIDSVQHRIAAVYYVNDSYQKKRYKYDYERTLARLDKGFKKFMTNSFYREYVIVNEDMIESVDYSSIDIINEIEEELGFLELLSQHLKLENELNHDLKLQFWYFNESVWGKDNLIDDFVPDLYFYSIAFPNKKYELTSKNIQKLIILLKDKKEYIRNAK